MFGCCYYSEDVAVLFLLLVLNYECSCYILLDLGFQAPSKTASDPRHHDPILRP